MKTNFVKLSVLGIIGGVLCVLSNVALYAGTQDIFANPDPFWLQFNTVRVAASEVLILFGCAGLLCGFISMYAMVKENCGKGLQILAACGVVAVVGTTLGHGNFGCIEPLVYNVLCNNGISETVYAQVDEIISSHFGLADVLIAFSSILQAVVVIILVVSKKAGVSRWMCLCNMIFTFALALILSKALNNSFGYSLLGCSKSIGETVMFTVPYLYWKKRNQLQHG